MADRYDTSELTEDQFEPGSNGTVLKNLQGITSFEKMEEAETTALWSVQKALIGTFSQNRTFTADDICRVHHQWLGEIYPWAGRYRQVNISKGGFDFAMAQAIPAMMEAFERQQLKKYTPCLLTASDEVAHALAEVHVELMLIHPFREGNGRLGRLLATVMALQAGLPPLDFSYLATVCREKYFAAVRAGLDRNYRPMKELFSAVIEKTLQSWEEG